MVMLMTDTLRSSLPNLCVTVQTNQFSLFFKQAAAAAFGADIPFVHFL